MSAVFTLFFEPLDVLHFREPRPWDAGSHVLSRSSFPTPGSLRGALRSALLSQLDADFGSSDPYYGVKEGWAQRLLGGRTDPGQITIRGPLLAISRELHKSAQATQQKPEPLFLPPQDLVCRKGSPRVHRLRLRELATIDEQVAPRRWHFSGTELLRETRTHLPWTSAELTKETLAGKYLVTAAGVARYRRHTDDGDLELPKIESLADYLKQGGQAQADHAALLAEKSVYQVESRIGIARDPDSLTVHEGMFYLALSYRFAPGAGLAIEVEASPGDSTGEQGAELGRALSRLHSQVIPLGGRGHRARVHVSQGSLIDPLWSVGSQAQASSQTSVWLITPLPWPVDQKERPKDVVSLITDRPQVIGGFDQAKRCPKPLRHALPAGSVLYLKDGASWESVRSGLRASQGDANAQEDRCLGYGTALLTPA